MVMDFRPVLHAVGVVLTVLACLMVVPAVVDAAYGYIEWIVFAVSAGLTLFCGLGLALGAAAEDYRLDVRQAFLTAVLAWVVPCFFAALPLMFGQAHLSFVDALFEATSGLTTTGATVISGLDTRPPGLLLWRAMLQWLGGIGVILMAIAILPMLNVGGMQMFGTEVSASNNRVPSRVLRQGFVVVLVYCGLGVIFAALLWSVGMTGFDSITHSMSILSTGGFSTHDASLAYYNEPAVDVVVCLGMVMGGLPFFLYLRTLRGEWAALPSDTQVRWFLSLLTVGIIANTLWLIHSNNILPLHALRYGALTIISIMSGTGLTILDFSHWLALPATIMFLSGFIGGCAGSTSSGIRVFRLQILLSNARMQIRSLLRPHGINLPSYQGRQIPKDVLTSTMGFLFIYAFSYAVLAIALGLLGLDFISALSAAGSAIANIGPGLGEVIGPSGSYASLNPAAKLVMSGGMILGRLEMVTVLVLFLPSFWRH